MTDTLRESAEIVCNIMRILIKLELTKYNKDHKCNTDFDIIFNSWHFATKHNSTRLWF